MADIVAFKSGANIVAFEKDGHKYGMCCAWATMVGYEEIAMLLGSQSITGNTIKINDIVGVSALADNQNNIAEHFGSSHSNEFDKFKDIDYSMNKGAITITGAKTEMVCKVIDIVHLKFAKEDNFVIMKIIDYRSGALRKFL